MIYHPTLINGGCSDIGQYFVDSSRLDLTNPDHAAFGMFLSTAANDPRKIIELYGEDNAELIDDVISHRMFNGGIVINPPCFVSDAVTFHT